MGLSPVEEYIYDQQNIVVDYMMERPILKSYWKRNPHCPFVYDDGSNEKLKAGLRNRRTSYLRYKLVMDTNSAVVSGYKSGTPLPIIDHTPH